MNIQVSINMDVLPKDYEQLRILEEQINDIMKDHPEFANIRINAEFHEDDPTNADKIRAMSNSQLAEMFSMICKMRNLQNNRRLSFDQNEWSGYLSSHDKYLPVVQDKRE